MCLRYSYKRYAYKYVYQVVTLPIIEDARKFHSVKLTWKQFCSIKTTYTKSNPKMTITRYNKVLYTWKKLKN